jgi:hypothetical protein
MNYFTSIEYTNGAYTGVAFSAGNNSPAYRSKPYQNQTDALADVNAFINNQPIAQGTTVTNNAVYSAPIPARPPVKCCGRQ